MTKIFSFSIFLSNQLFLILYNWYEKLIRLLVMSAMAIVKILCFFTDVKNETYKSPVAFNAKTKLMLFI